jgi:hypothetical protein
MKLCLHFASVATRNAQHDSAKWHFPDLHEQVNVIRHPAVRMNPRTESIDRLGDDFIQPITMLVPEENVLSMITTQGHVIETKRNVQPGSSRHPCLQMKLIPGCVFLMPRSAQASLISTELV